MPDSPLPMPVRARLRPHLLPLLIILLVTAVVYARALGHHFLVNWDDPEYVIDNGLIRGLSFAHVGRAFTSFYFSNYAPLHLISYMLDYELWGLKPAGFILSNIILQAANGISLYLLVLRLDGRRLAALAASLLFLLHPVQVESVAWVAERKNLLAMFFFLLTLHAYVRYRERGWSQGQGWYGACLVACTAALLSKSVAVVIPPVLLLYDLCHTPRDSRCGTLARLVPFALLALLFAGLALVSHAPGVGGGRTSYHGGTPLATFLTMLPVMVDYLMLLVWPAGLSAVYDPIIHTGIDLSVLLAGLCLVALASVAVLLWRRAPRLFFWGAVYWLGLLPVSQIVPIATLMNDRYLYLPMAGAAPFVVLGAFDLAGRLGRAWRVAAAGVGIALLLACGIVSFLRVDVWRDASTLWSDAVAKTPSSQTACFALGAAFSQEEHLTDPRDTLTLAQAFDRADLPDNALPIYELTLRLDPRNGPALQGLGRIRLRRGEQGEAVTLLERLRTVQPENGEAQALLAEAYLLAGRLPEAEDAIGRAAILLPSAGAPFRLLGDLRFRQFRIDEARAAYRRAISLDPGNGRAHFQLSCLEAVSGRPEVSLDEMEEALRRGYRKPVDLGRHPLHLLPAYQQLLARYKP